MDILYRLFDAILASNETLQDTGRIEGKYVSERTFEKVKSCLAKAEEIKKGVKKSEDTSDEKGQENLDENLSTPAGTSEATKEKQKPISEPVENLGETGADESGEENKNNILQEGLKGKKLQTYSHTNGQRK